MTVRYSVEVFCDRCGNWMSGINSADKPNGLASKALKAAKQKGWSRDVKSTYLDLCPDCLGAARAEVVR